MSVLRVVVVEVLCEKVAPVEPEVFPLEALLFSSPLQQLQQTRQQNRKHLRLQVLSRRTVDQVDLNFIQS